MTLATGTSAEKRTTMERNPYGSKLQRKACNPVVGKLLNIKLFIYVVLDRLGL
jgi:hypothetical protein